MKGMLKFWKRAKLTQPPVPAQPQLLSPQATKPPYFESPMRLKRLEEARKPDVVERADENIATHRDYYPDLYTPETAPVQIMQTAVRIHAKEVVRAALIELSGASNFLVSQIQKEEGLEQFERQLSRAMELLQQARDEVEQSKNPQISSWQVQALTQGNGNGS